MLYCEEGPPFGGETGFADTYATFQGLSEKDREFLRGKTCIHDFDAFRFQQGRSGVSEGSTPPMSPPRRMTARTASISLA